MNKITLFLITIITLIVSSCTNQGSRTGDSNSFSNTPSLHPDTLKIEKFALNFIREHPDFNNNSITKEEARKEFQKQFKESVDKDSLLRGVPMTLRTIREMNGKYIAHFWVSHDALPRDLIDPFHQISFDFSTSVPKETALQLKEKEDYLLDVKYVSHIDNIETFQYMVGYNDWVLTDDFEIKKNDSYGRGEYNIALGLMLVDFISASPYSK